MPARRPAAATTPITGTLAKTHTAVNAASKTIVSGDGIVTAIVAVTGITDQVNDVIVPGAFTRTLTVRRPKVVFHHDWLRFAGRVLSIVELPPGDSRLPATTNDGKPWPADAGALLATMQFNLNAEGGREAYEWARFYSESDECEWSIGYKVVPGKTAKRRDGARLIYDLDVFEVSLVLFGAAQQTRTLQVKDTRQDLDYKTCIVTGTVDAPAGSALAALMEAKAATAPADPTGPTVGGLAVLAADTGRALMLQRALTHNDPAAGKWEFPGGHLEGDETPADGAVREWQEETGLTLPAGEHVDSYDAPGGIYRLHAYRIPIEADVQLNPDHEDRPVANPDDPRGSMPEVTAWWDLRDAQANPALRSETADNTPWAELAGHVGGKVEKDLETKTAAYAVMQAKQLVSLTDPRTPVGPNPGDTDICPCGIPVAFDAMNGWQHDDGSISHDDGTDESVSDKMRARMEGKNLAGAEDGPIGTPGGRQNWVDEVGGLPPYIRRIARDLIENGHDESSAIRIAVGVCQKWKDGGGNVTEQTQAKAAAAIAEWEAKKAQSHTDNMEGKAMPQMSGSYEERQDALRAALTSLLIPPTDDGDGDGDECRDRGWVCIEATYPDRVYCTPSLYGQDGKGESYEVPYTFGDDGNVELGQPAPMKLSVVAVPDASDDPLDAEPTSDDDATDLRFILPAIAALSNATGYVSLAPKVQGKSLDGLRTSALALLDALAVKGLDPYMDPEEKAADTADPWAGLLDDDGDTDNGANTPDGDADDTTKLKTAENTPPSATGSDAAQGDADETSTDAGDAASDTDDNSPDAAKDDAEDAADGGADEAAEGESEPADDGEPKDNGDGTVTLDPEKVKAQIAALKS